MEEELDKLINRQNYLWINEFLFYLLDIKRLSENSVGRYRAYLRSLLLWACEIPLNQVYKMDQSFASFVSQFTYSKGNRSGISLNNQTQKKIIITSRMFFRWAKDYYEKKFRQVPGYWINDLIPPKVSSSNSVHKYITIDEVLKISTLPEDWQNLAFMRDRAAVCMLFLSGMRVGAFVSLPLEAVNLRKLEMYQWPEEFHVHTKNHKHETTTLLLIPELLKLVTQWDEYLRSQVPEDQWIVYPWYPPIQNNWGEMKLSYKTLGVNREIALNKRLRLLFEKAEIEYKSAHKFRHGHAVYGVERCRTMAEYQALSRNLMHESISITDGIYAGMELRERKQLIAGLTINPQNKSSDALIAFIQGLGKQELLKAITVAAGELSGK